MNPITERDQGRCVRCGTIAAGGSVHHRVLGNRKNNEPWNQILLCGSGTTGCHSWVHSHSLAAQGGGWVISKYHPEPWLVPVLYEQPGRSGRFVLEAGFRLSPAIP